MTESKATVGLGQLLHLDLIRLRNTFKYGGLHQVSKTAVFALLTALFIIIELDVTRLLFNNIMKQEYLEELRFVLLSKLLYMVFLVFSALLVYSNIISSISVFFLSPEIDLIYMRPISRRTFFIYRFSETFFQSSWMFIAFGIPILISYGRALGHGLEFIVPLILVVLPVLVIPSAAGCIIAILLIRVFSPRRTQRILIVVGICLAVGLIVIFRWMAPQQIIDPIGVEQLALYLQTLRVPMLTWLPVTWAAESLSASGEGGLFTTDAAKYLAWLWITAFVVMGCAYLVFRGFWFAAKSGGRGAETSSVGVSRKRRRTRPKAFRMGFLYRDSLLFIRDASQWSQIIIIVALIAIYVYNFKNLPYALYGFQYSMAFVSVAASGLILSALLARFAYPAVSMEGNAFHLIQTAPISWRRYLWYKFFFYFIPSILISFLLVYFSVVVLDAGPRLIVRCLLATLSITTGCTALAVTFGALFPQFHSPDPSRIAVSAGGLFFMFASIGYIGTIIFMTVFPDIIRFFSFYSKWIWSIQNMNPDVIWLPIYLVTFVVTCGAMNWGIRSLRNTPEMD